MDSFSPPSTSWGRVTASASGFVSPRIWGSFELTDTSNRTTSTLSTSNVGSCFAVCDQKYLPASPTETARGSDAHVRCYHLYFRSVGRFTGRVFKQFQSPQPFSTKSAFRVPQPPNYLGNRTTRSLTHHTRLFTIKRASRHRSDCFARSIARAFQGPLDFAATQLPYCEGDSLRSLKRKDLWSCWPHQPEIPTFSRQKQTAKAKFDMEEDIPALVRTARPDLHLAQLTDPPGD